MKKLIISILAISSICFLASPVQSNASDIQSPEMVYICTGSSSARYHRKADCWGLQSCKGSIKRLPKDEAEKKYHRTPCKVCYKLK